MKKSRTNDNNIMKRWDESNEKTKKNKENVHSERIEKSLEGGENYVKNKTNMLTISSIIYFK